MSEGQEGGVLKKVGLLQTPRNISIFYLDIPVKISDQG
jgi:hypothetical protein